MNRNVLFVTTVDLSRQSGGTLYSKSVLNALSSQFTVTTLVLANVQKVRSRPLRWCLALLLSIYNGIPPNINFHSGILRKESLSLLAKNWDLIVIDHLESFCIIKIVLKMAQSQFLYISHNRESRLVDQKLPSVPSWVKIILAYWIEKIEISLTKSALGVISISCIEAEWYKQFSNNVEVLYPVFRSKGITRDLRNAQDVLRVGFLGSGDWRPNNEAVRVLIRNIFPYTERRIDFVLAGGEWNKDIIADAVAQAIPHKNVNINVLGYVPDVAKFWSSIDVFVAYIVNGAGVNVKICESLANGIPVIASQYAVRGLTKNILMCGGIIQAHSTTEFAKQLKEFQIGRINFPSPFEFTSSYAERCLLNATKFFWHVKQNTETHRPSEDLD